MALDQFLGLKVFGVGQEHELAVQELGFSDSVAASTLKAKRLPSSSGMMKRLKFWISMLSTDPCAEVTDLGSALAN